jgi:hypothetical protein
MASIPSNLVMPGADAGTLVIPSLGRTIRLVEWREDDFYDTVQVGTAPAAGTSYEFFRDLVSKNIQHTNLRTQRRIPAGSEFILTRIGLLVHQALANAAALDLDMIKLAYAASLTFKINDRLITEGPAVKFQSGLGVTGSTTRTTTGVVTLGVPSAAAAPSLLVAQSIKDDDDLQATLDFKDNAWITGGSAMPTFAAGPAVSLMLHGLIKKPQGK